MKEKKKNRLFQTLPDAAEERSSDRLGGVLFLSLSPIPLAFGMEGRKEEKEGKTFPSRIDAPALI